MKLLIFVLGTILLFACSNKRISFKSSLNKQVVKERTSENYKLLKEFALMSCVCNTEEGKQLKQKDISGSIYANILNYNGIDTLSSLSKIAAANIKEEKYIDYKDKKAIFFRCFQWINSKEIDSLIIKYSDFKIYEDD